MELAFLYMMAHGTTYEYAVGVQNFARVRGLRFNVDTLDWE